MDVRKGLNVVRKDTTKDVMFRQSLFAGIALLIAFSLSACSGLSGLDVVGKDAVRAFGEVLAALPADEYEPGRWKLAAADGGAWFFFDNTGAGMVVDPAPFVAAGLDLSKLESEITGVHNVRLGEVSIYFMSAGLDMLNQNAEADPLKQFETNAKGLRDSIGYHAALDHYNIALGNGNLFEWAKDFSVNGTTKENQDKDIVFVLNPEPLIAAGVDPEKVDGWIYAQVSVDIDGKPTDVYKFLKPFDLV